MDIIMLVMSISIGLKLGLSIAKFTEWVENRFLERHDNKNDSEAQ